MTQIIRKGEKVKSNAQFAARMKRIADELNREIATVAGREKYESCPPPTPKA